MKVVVVGGMGFLGSHVCEMFKAAGEQVVAVDNLTKFELLRTGYNVEDARDYNVKYLAEKKVLFLKDDVRNKDMMEQICNDADYVVNCSAQPAMTIGIEHPQLDFDTNLRGLLNLLEICRKRDIPLAHCSTIHVYGNGLNQMLVEENEDRFTHPNMVINEHYPLLRGRLTPLHASKRAGEIYMQTYIDTYGLKCFCARLSGIYGERQMGGEDHGWVANFAIRTLHQMPITVFGHDRQVRDVLYVKDAARLFEQFWTHQRSGVYNCGGGHDFRLSIKECLHMLNDMTKLPQKISVKPPRMGDLWWFVTDINKVSQALKWKPTVAPADGIKNLVEWIKEVPWLFFYLTG